MKAAYKTTWLVVILSTFLAGFLVPPGESAIVIAAPAPDACCDDEQACSSFETTDTDELPADDNCCRGCAECGPLCCCAPLSVLPALITCDAAGRRRGTLVPDATEVSRVDRDRIYHPPRD